MLPDVLISALVQAPFVLAMAYLVQRFLLHIDTHNAEWRRFMGKADTVYVEKLGRLAESIDRLNANVERMTELLLTHDAAVRGALGRRGDPPENVVPFRREE